LEALPRPVRRHSCRAGVRVHGRVRRHVSACVFKARRRRYAPVHKDYVPPVQTPQVVADEPSINGAYGGAWGAALLDRLIFGASFQDRQVPVGPKSSWRRSRDLVYGRPDSQRAGEAGGMREADSCVCTCLRPVSVPFVLQAERARCAVLPSL
jgi:hypothetical protein